MNRSRGVSNALTDSNSKKDLVPIFLEYALPLSYFWLLWTWENVLILSPSVFFSPAFPHLPMCVCAGKHVCEVTYVCVGSYMWSIVQYKVHFTFNFFFFANGFLTGLEYGTLTFLALQRCRGLCLSLPLKKLDY